ncbi:MAG: Crp/Fnr family transcriptional regulator [Thermonemataceae bacterium]
MDTDVTEFIQGVWELPKEVLEEFCKSFQLLDIPKDYFLLREGKVCKHIWVIHRGLVRHFYTDEKGKERNTWFSAEYSFTSNVISLLNQNASRESIQLLEDSIIYAIPQATITALQQKHHSFCRWYIKMLESFYFAQIDQRVDELQFLNATERYHNLLERAPTFSRRISLGNISSYLNISQETLSRIRSGK